MSFVAELNAQSRPASHRGVVAASSSGSSAICADFLAHADAPLDRERISAVSQDAHDHRDLGCMMQLTERLARSGFCTEADTAVSAAYGIARDRHQPVTQGLLCIDQVTRLCRSAWERSDIRVNQGLPTVCDAAFYAAVTTLVTPCVNEARLRVYATETLQRAAIRCADTMPANVHPMARALEALTVGAPTPASRYFFEHAEELPYGLTDALLLAQFRMLWDHPEQIDSSSETVLIERARDFLQRTAATRRARQTEEAFQNAGRVSINESDALAAQGLLLVQGSDVNTLAFGNMLATIAFLGEQGVMVHDRVQEATRFLRIPAPPRSESMAVQLGRLLGEDGAHAEAFRLPPEDHAWISLLRFRIGRARVYARHGGPGTIFAQDTCPFAQEMSEVIDRFLDTHVNIPPELYVSEVCSATVEGAGSARRCATNNTSNFFDQVLMTFCPAAAPTRF